MRIALVNDQPIALEALRKIIITVPSYEICWVALNGLEAVKKSKSDMPDLILMNLLMPVMNGAEATCRIMKESPCPILLVTSSIESNQGLVFEAMGCGALDVAAMPTLNQDESNKSVEFILQKISMIARLTGKMTNQKNRIIPNNSYKKSTLPCLIAIGSSTGGPKALAEIISRLPKDLGASIVIVQHVDSQFANGLAEWLNQQAAIDVQTAKQGESIELNKAYIASTNDHLILSADYTFHYTNKPIDYPYRPSVNEFFYSIDNNWKRKDLAIVLTGMGNDGALGLLKLKNNGWHTIAQDEKTSIVFGMPKAAIELGAAIEVLDIKKIANSIIKFVNSRQGN